MISNKNCNNYTYFGMYFINKHLIFYTPLYIFFVYLRSFDRFYWEIKCVEVIVN